MKTKAITVMAKDAEKVLHIKKDIDFINQGIFNNNMKLSLTTEIVKDKNITWCILYVNDVNIYADYAEKFQTEIIYGLSMAHSLGYDLGYDNAMKTVATF